MAKIEMLQRLLLIINKLDIPGKYVKSGDLQEYVKEEMQFRYGSTCGYSSRTIQRDIRSIDELFGITIKHRAVDGYYIADKEQISTNKCEELLLNFDILSALNSESGLKRYVLAEHHRPIGSENLPKLMDAIRNNYHIEFDYTFYRYDDKVVHKRVAPHFLKENRQLWYLIGYDEGKLKTFGIDRISNLQLLEDEPFTRDGSIDVENMFRDCFGIWNQEDIPVEEIILSYSALDGKFLKATPLHHSQTILVDTEEEFRIKVRLRITNDFIMELLSRSKSLTVIEPLSLRERINNIYINANKRNS